MKSRRAISLHVVLAHNGVTVLYAGRSGKHLRSCEATTIAVLLSNQCLELLHCIVFPLLPWANHYVHHGLPHCCNDELEVKRDRIVDVMASSYAVFFACASETPKVFFCAPT